jgi:hypothetical protein
LASVTRDFTDEDSVRMVNLLNDLFDADAKADATIHVVARNDGRSWLVSVKPPQLHIFVLVRTSIVFAEVTEVELTAGADGAFANPGVRQELECLA